MVNYRSKYRRVGTPNAINIEVIVSNYVQRHKAQCDIEQTCYLLNFIIDLFSIFHRHNRCLNNVVQKSKHQTLDTYLKIHSQSKQLKTDIHKYLHSGRRETCNSVRYVVGAAVAVDGGGVYCERALGTRGGGRRAGGAGLRRRHSTRRSSDSGTRGHVTRDADADCRAPPRTVTAARPKHPALL